MRIGGSRPNARSVPTAMLHRSEWSCVLPKLDGGDVEGGAHWQASGDEGELGQKRHAHY